MLLPKDKTNIYKISKDMGKQYLNISNQLDILSQLGESNSCPD